MVKKLLKYEFSSLAKTLLPMEIVLFSIAFFNRIVQFFENDSTPYNIFIVSSSVLLGIAMMVCLIFTFAICIVRFYKNIYTAQGYLTLTLPATHAQHIWAKLISAVCASAVALVSVFLALAVSTAGDVFHEILKAAAYLIEQYFKLTKANGAFYIIEGLFCLILSVVGEYLLIYTCITVGQLAKKNRVLAAFGVYFGIYVAWQIIETVVIIIFSILYTNGLLENLYAWIIKHPFPFTHIVLTGLFVLLSIFCVLCFFITHRIMKNKLNIE